MKCKKCNHQFKYLESINTGLIPKIGVKCPKCKTQLYYTAKSRKQSMYLIFIMPIIAFLLIMFNVDVTVSIGIAGIIGLMTIFLFPFTMELTDEEEPLW